MQDQDLDWDIDMVCRFFGGTKPLNPSTVYRGIKDARIPPPYHPTPGISRWAPEECRKARRKLMAARYSDDAAQTEEADAETPEAAQLLRHALLPDVNPTIMLHTTEEERAMTNFKRESTKAEKPSTRADGVEDDLSKDQWLIIRKEEAQRIDPDTAEVFWRHAYVADPYGVDPDLPEECRSIGRACFARSPDSEIWVWFGDLPDEVRNKFWTLCR